MDKFIGLTTAETQLAADKLSRLLANTYLLQLKTQSCHWNVEDPYFSALHAFFESQYNALNEAVDDVAERIRMLGHRTPASFGQFLKLTTLSEDKSLKNRDEMMKALLHDHEVIINDLREVIDMLEEDEGTKDFFIERLRDHEKMAWMLRSHLV